MHRQCSSCSRAWAVHKLCRLILNINVKDIVCVSERLQVFVSVCLECVCVCVFMSLRLKVACVSRWSEYFPKEQRADVLWVCVCVCMSGQVWRYEEADGFYGDGGDGDTTHTSIRAQRGNGWRWHWWVCDVISCSQWRDSLKLAELWAKLWRKLSQPSWIVLAKLKGYLGGFPWVWRPMTLWWGGELQVCWAFQRGTSRQMRK